MKNDRRKIESVEPIESERRKEGKKSTRRKIYERSINDRHAWVVCVGRAAERRWMDAAHRGGGASRRGASAGSVRCGLGSPRLDSAWRWLIDASPWRRFRRQSSSHLHLHLPPDRCPTHPRVCYRHLCLSLAPRRRRRRTTIVTHPLLKPTLRPAKVTSANFERGAILKSFSSTRILRERERVSLD